MIALLTILFAIFLSINHVLKADEFDGTKLKKFKGSKFWDIRVAEKKYHDMHLFKYLLVICFADAYHLSNTLAIATPIGAIIYASFYPGFIIDSYLPWWGAFIALWVFFFIAFEATRFFIKIDYKFQ